MALTIHSAGERFGTVLAARSVGRFVLRRSSYSALLAIPSHQHEAPYFSWVGRGFHRERGCRGVHRYGTGSLHFHPSGDPHSAVMGPRGMVALSVAPMGRLGLRLDALAPSPAVLEDPGTRLIAARCDRELSATDTASDLALEGLCLELLASGLRRTRRREDPAAPHWIVAARDYLHERLEGRVSLAELAGVAGVHEAHLTRIFRRHFGCSPGNYLRRLRVERARLALIDSEVPIVEIALAAGFSSQSHFTRVFHRLVGSPPARYRRQLGRSG